jgi:hypothetical protein
VFELLLVGRGVWAEGSLGVVVVIFAGVVVVTTGALVTVEFVSVLCDARRLCDLALRLSLGFAWVVAVLLGVVIGAVVRPTL